MAALLPLVGGLLLARFIGRRAVVVAVSIVLYALAAAVITATAPSHSSSYGVGLLLSAVLAPGCVLTVLLGSWWRQRSLRTSSASTIV